jgi:hypothetical protein
MTPYLLSLLYNLMVLRVSTNIFVFNKYEYQIMARINIDIGVQGNPATGDTLRTAMQKINTNFTEVYSLVRDGSSGLIATDVTNGDLKLQANGTGSIEIDTLSIQNSTISSITTNSDITITPNGTGNVVLGNFTFNADQTVGASEDNYVFTYDHSTGTIGLEASAAGDVTASSTTTFTNKTFDANGTGNSISNIDIADFTSGVFLDEDNMASNSATAIASQQSIKAYVDAEDANIASDTLTFTNKTIDANGTGNSISNLEVADFAAASIVTAGEGIGSNNNDTTIPTSAAVKAYADSVGGGSTGDITFNGSTIQSPSNADITLDPSGTGGVVAQGPVTFNAGYIEKINSLTSSSTITVDCSAASIHTVTLGTNTEFNITNLPTGGSVTLIITQDGTGTRTATFGTDGSSAVKFPSNSSTLSTGGGDIDVVTIINDGTNFLGNIAKDYRSS